MWETLLFHTFLETFSWPAVGLFSATKKTGGIWVGCRVGRFFGIFGREFVLERGYFWGAPLGERVFLLAALERRGGEYSHLGWGSFLIKRRNKGNTLVLLISEGKNQEMKKKGELAGILLGRKRKLGSWLSFNQEEFLRYDCCGFFILPHYHMIFPLFLPFSWIA